MSERDRRALLWLTCAAVCWRWLVAVRTPLPGVDATRDLWVAQQLANGDVTALASRWWEPLHARLMAPALAFGASGFATAQVVACLAGGLAVLPAAFAAERLRQGAGVPAAVVAMAGAGAVVGAGGDRPAVREGRATKLATPGKPRALPAHEARMLAGVSAARERKMSSCVPVLVALVLSRKLMPFARGAPEREMRPSPTRYSTSTSALVPVQYKYHAPASRVRYKMRAVAVGLIVATATARPSNLNDDCNEAIAIVGGASPVFGAMGSLANTKNVDVNVKNSA